MAYRYIADFITSEECETWLKGKKVVLKAPTGMGKTTFILKVFLKCCKAYSKKVLILCNRRLLAEQYDFDISGDYWRFVEMDAEVEIRTYQQLAEALVVQTNIEFWLSEFDVIICDECHYFYADSDFNAWGTYVLLHAFVQASYFKTVVYLTATYKEIQPLLVETYEACKEYLEKKNSFPGMEKYHWNDTVYDFGEMEKNDRFICYWTPDVETLVSAIADSSKKSIIFIDDKQKAEEFKKKLISMGKLHEHEIFLLNSDVLDDNRKSKVIQKLAVAGILQPKVLITTSVLDNGVSIHDEDVGNVVIATESELSFKQMLGRIRAEDSTSCNLYIYPRTPEYYQKRVEQYTEKIRMFDEIEQKIKQHKAFQILCSAFYGSTERKDFLHNALVFSNEVVTIFEKNIPAVYISYGNLKLNINKFAKEKTGNLMLMEKCFLKLSLKNTVLVAHKQISWIGKASNELKIIPSTYFEEQKNQLVDKLRRVKNLSLKEFSGLKCEVAEKYQKTLFPDIPFNGGSFSNDKFMEVCNRYGLEVSTEKGVDNKNVYSINVVSSDA